MWLTYIDVKKKNTYVRLKDGKRQPLNHCPHLRYLFHDLMRSADVLIVSVDGKPADLQPLNVLVCFTSYLGPVCQI